MGGSARGGSWPDDCAHAGLINAPARGDGMAAGLKRGGGGKRVRGECHGGGHINIHGDGRLHVEERKGL